MMTDKMELNEEWNNFMKKVGEVSSLVKDMASGDKEKAEAAKQLADRYIEGKVIVDEDVKMTVKHDRTVINQKAFENTEGNKGEIDKDAWMKEVSKDAERRALDRKIRREKAETLKTQAVKAFRRGEYERALSCYNRAIDEVRDNPMLYCDRALTNIKLGNFDKVVADCELALRLNENSFKARLYRAKAYKELDESEKLDISRKELSEMFLQHEDLITYFLDKQFDNNETDEQS
ncbi:tetratricopeptide repeat protein 12 [Aricia agestis]|uniref:tetratricopeptide repeat protein 12 n=1 Tax=Aricia agestis TaxID=91739 RepID=UPI001C2081FD|nr:tetratricopeptide repeat protein 12 [Aricia agestis]XP_041970410.1 tetratricopeptide repeat protein 12 [Aricia agestis]XP_041970411.1 tetratricopeptide repeat protein 12 [Aricia agestis]